jgi:single-strand DNA-binding protein
MRSVNKVILIGNLGKDAETKYTPSNKAVANFSLATSRRVKDGDGWRDETTWINVVLWNAEKVAEFLKKGKQVYIEGRLQTRSYESHGEKKYVTEVIAEELILLGGGEVKDVSPEMTRRGQASGQPASRPAPSASAFTDEDVPF